MRSLRVGLTGAVVLALASGLSGVVVAQELAEGTATAVTGTLVEEVQSEDGPWQHTYEWSDPRLPAVFMTNYEGAVMYGGDRWGIDPMVFWGTETGVDENGSWAGTFEGIGYPGGRWVSRDTLYGSGAYEGLVAILDYRAHDPAPGEYVGLIIEGEVPLPSLAQPASD